MTTATTTGDSASAASALVLFAHGARDARWAEPLQRLQQELCRRAPGIVVGLAYLEMQAPTLPDALDALVAKGVRALRVAPVFWSLGGHVARDLPALVAQFQARHPQVQVSILAPIAELAGIDAFLADAWLRDAVAGSEPGAA